MKFYAVSWTYGSNVSPDAGQCVSFPSRADRDEWVSNGNPYVGPGERTAISASQARSWHVTPYDQTDEYKQEQIDAYETDND